MKIKRMIRTMITICIAAALLLALAGCTKTLNGTYVSKGLLAESVTFSSNGTVTMSAFGLDVNGTYRINDGKMIITYSAFSLSYDWELDFRQEGRSIFLNGEEFVKK